MNLIEGLKATNPPANEAKEASLHGASVKKKGIAMAKNNNYKKLFRMDEFGRRLYCPHSRLNLVRTEKKSAKKKARQEQKRLPSEDECEIYAEEFEINS